ncbi:MAG TPA: HAD-IB family phosphatase [Bacteroidota bacterium]|nr:HAD-IB family phosphatase [Bacteroidota bacterium]
MTEELTYIVFTDFDGTITRNDIGDTMFGVFGDREEAGKAFRDSVEGIISAQESWRRSCATVASLSTETFGSFVEGQEIDAGFHRFERYCKSLSIPIHILSDGFDVYIKQVLQRENLGHLPFYANRLEIQPGGTIVPVFPFADEECIKCANCKRNHVLTRSSDENVIVYIGNGHSDQCPARYADIIFAKQTLLKYCERENITYHRFDTFDDILRTFKSIVEDGRPRKRRTAELLRKEIFMRG